MIGKRPAGNKTSRPGRYRRVAARVTTRVALRTSITPRENTRTEGASVY
ncbi:hypothetical protein AB0O91_26355 [Kitasatospora sp. NPDC089797]